MGLSLEQDSMSRPLLARTKLCRDWLDQVQAVVQRLAVSNTTPSAHSNVASARSAVGN